jgi:hypothetical protein
VTTTIEFIPTGTRGTTDPDPDAEPFDVTLVKWVIEVDATRYGGHDEILDAFLLTVKEVDEEATVKVTADYGDHVTAFEM